MKVIKTIALILLAFSCPVSAQNNRQVISADDLAGCWTKVDFSEEAKSKINQVQFGEDRFQIFCFEPEGTLRIIGSSRPLQEKLGDVQSAFAGLPKIITYQVVKPGIVVMTHAEARQTTGWVSSFTARDMQFDGKSFPKETLTMGLIDPDKQKVVYWRYLLRMEEDK